MKKGKKTTKTNPLLGKEVWTLTITNDFGRGETCTMVYTSFRKALNGARIEFKETGNMDSWEAAKKELEEQWFFHDPNLFNGDCFLIECCKIF